MFVNVEQLVKEKAITKKAITKKARQGMKCLIDVSQTFISDLLHSLGTSVAIKLPYQCSNYKYDNMQALSVSANKALDCTV